MAMFTVTVEGDRELVGKLSLAPTNVRNAIRNKIQRLALMLEAKLKKEHLSGPTGPHSLSVKTGALRRSVFQTVVETSQGTTGTVGYGADVPYAAIHEFGGTIHIPEIVPTKAKVLHFVIGGKDVFAKRVRAHTVTIPERAPLRTAFEELKPRIQEELSSGVKEGLGI